MMTIRTIRRFGIERYCAPGVRLRLLTGIAIWLAASSIAIAACSAPADLGAHIKAKPSAANYAALGVWFADKKQFECAATNFASAFRLEPKAPQLAYLSGLSLYSAGDDVGALAALDQATKLDPADIRPHLVLGAALGRMKKIAEAEAEWRAALALDPDSPSALDSFSQLLVDQKDYPSVVALLEKPSGDRTRSELQSLNLGTAYAGMVRLDDAVRVLREGLNTVPESLPIADELALVLMLQSRSEEAIAVVELALTKHPDDQRTQVLYLRILVASHSDKAQELARKLLKSYPESWEVEYFNGQLESREGNFASARSYLERAVALNPSEANAQDALGGVLSQLGELQAAKEHLEKAIALGNNEPEVQYDLARVLQKLGDKTDAQAKLRTYQQLKNARSNKVQAAGKGEEGDQAMTAGDAAKAAALYREAIESDPDEAILQYKLSQALDKLKDIGGETKALKRAIELRPDLAEAQNQMGYLTAHAGEPEKAERYLRAAVAASPSFVVAWVNLAATLASEAKWADAKQALRSALAVDPDSVQARRLDQAIAEAHPGP